MQDFVKRNAPVFVIGLITLSVFILIIVAASFQTKKIPALQNISKESLLTDHTYTFGNKDAKVVLVEFSDFQCPACKAMAPIVKQITEKYQNDLLFAYKHFPLSQHPYARDAAKAAQVAGEQGKFWEYHDKLFENSPNLAKDDLIKFAGEIGLDVEKFKKDFDDAKFENQVADDNSTGLKLGINSTPTFILNNTIIELTSGQDFENKIIEEIKKFNSEIESTTSEPKTLDQTLVPQTSESANQIAQNIGSVIEVEYTSEGFYPSNIKAQLGQKLRWINNADYDLKIVQLIKSYSQFNEAVIVKPGENYDLVLNVEKLWTYKDLDHKHYASVYVANE